MEILGIGFSITFFQCARRSQYRPIRLRFYSEHKSLGKVAESLNHQKIETRRGKPFSRMTIKNMDFLGFAGHNLSRILRQEVSHDPT